MMATTAPDKAAFLPFTRPHRRRATIAAVGEVLRSGWITTGPQVPAFEAALSQLFGGRPVRSFANGTATMEIALRVAGIGAGDEVITTPLSWVATANVILAVGARPVFVDIDPAHAQHRSRRCSRRRSRRARARSCRSIWRACRSTWTALYAHRSAPRLRVIEDAAQAIGSRWNGARIGGFGDLVSFSFHANKNITSAEGGCLVLNNEDEARAGRAVAAAGRRPHAAPTAWTSTCRAASTT